MEKCCKNCIHYTKFTWGEGTPINLRNFGECLKVSCIGIYDPRDFGNDYIPNDYDCITYNGDGPDELALNVRNDFCCKYFKPKK